MVNSLLSNALEVVFIDPYELLEDSTISNELYVVKTIQIVLQLFFPLTY